METITIIANTEKAAKEQATTVFRQRFQRQGLYPDAKILEVKNVNKKVWEVTFGYEKETKTEKVSSKKKR
jgi:hypothetical protein